MEGISQGMPSFFALFLGKWDLHGTYIGVKTLIFWQIFWRNRDFWLFLQNKSKKLIMEYKEYQSPSFFEAYINAFKYCLDFDDRSRRAEYWKFAAIFDFCAIGLLVAYKMFDSIGVAIIFAIFAIVHLLPAYSVLARRLHDSGHSAKWIIGIFIPFIGVVFSSIIFVFTLMDSEKEYNNWGESPKYYIEND